MSKKSDKKKHKKLDAPAPAQADWRPRHTQIVFGAILAFALLIGFSSIYQFRESPFSDQPALDEASYVSWADEVAGGEIIGSKVYYQDPLYPYFLALIFTALGKNFLVVRVIHMLMVVASLAMVFWTARKLMGEKPALLATAIMALYGGQYYFGLLIIKATMVIFISTASCALGVLASHRPRSFWPWLGLGISLGLLLLLRGNFQAVIPFLLVWAFLFAGESWLERVSRTSYLGIGLAIVLVPVTVRNYVVGGELVLTTSQGGANFFIGNNERADGQYGSLPFVRLNPVWEAKDFQAEAERRAGRELKPTEVSSFWFDESFKWIKGNPGDAARLFFHKARLMIHQHELPDNHSYYLTRDLFVGSLWVPFLGLGMLWGPAVAGMWVSFCRDRRSLYPALFALLYAGSVVPFFVVARYRLPVVPALSIFSAAFVFWAIEKLRQSDPLDTAKRNLKYTLSVCAWPLLAPESKERVSEYLASKKQRKLHLVGGAVAATALIVLVPLGLLPTTESKASMGDEYLMLGSAYLNAGKPAAAVKYYDKALEVLDNHALTKRITERNRSVAMSLIAGDIDDINAILARTRVPGTTAEELRDLGRNLEDRGQTRAAVETYERAVARDPGLFLPHARLGFLYAMYPDLKNVDKAIMHFNKALEINPDDVAIMHGLGNCHFISDNKEEARRWWNEVLKRRPEHSGARLNLENLLGDGKKF